MGETREGDLLSGDSSRTAENQLSSVTRPVKRKTRASASSSSYFTTTACLMLFCLATVSSLVHSFSPSSSIVRVHRRTWTANRQEQQSPSLHGSKDLLRLRQQQQKHVLGWSLGAQKDDDDDDDDIVVPPPPSIPSKKNPAKKAQGIVAEISLTLKRVSWLSWWSQMILTVSSSVILIFAKNVVSAGLHPSMAYINFLLPGTGIMVSFLSIFWTWGGGARLSRRLLRRPTSKIQTANMLRRAIRVGVTLNLAGMLLTLLGAEQTIGVLAIKVLTARPWATGGMMAAGTMDYNAGLQPLDILVVQANTNVLLSHFCSLVALLYLTRYVKKLDPPSSEDKARQSKLQL